MSLVALMTRDYYTEHTVSTRKQHIHGSTPNIIKSNILSLLFLTLRTNCKHTSELRRHVTVHVWHVQSHLLFLIWPTYTRPSDLVHLLSCTKINRPGAGWPAISSLLLNIITPQCRKQQQMHETCRQWRSVMCVSLMCLWGSWGNSLWTQCQARRVAVTWSDEQRLLLVNFLIRETFQCLKLGGRMKTQPWFYWPCYSRRGKWSIYCSSDKDPGNTEADEMFCYSTMNISYSPVTWGFSPVV